VTILSDSLFNIFRGAFFEKAVVRYH